MPKAFVACWNRAHIFISLRTFCPRRAGSLAAQLDAFLDELTTMPDARLLTQPQLDGMLREVLMRHLAKLDRVAAVAKVERGFDRGQAERDDRRTAWVYRLLESKGPSAQVSDDDREAILADGFTGKEVEFIAEHLCRLRDGDTVPTKPHILRPLLEAQDAEPTAANLAQAQQIYFRGMRLALEQTATRYRAERYDDDALVAGLIRAEVDRRVADVSAAAIPEPTRDSCNANAIAGDSSVPPKAPAPTAPSAPSPVYDGIVKLGEMLGRQRDKERAWDKKTAKQAARLYALFQRFVTEECGVAGLSSLRQPHLAKFVNFLQFEVYRHYGKSVADEARTIAELRKIAEGKSTHQRGVQPPTLNRHLTFLNQLIDYARGQGVRLDPDLSTARLRARNTKDDRARNARVTLKPAAAARMFALPPFTGCRSWKEPLEAGEEVFHRALYFVPMLLFYGGGRREEFCGLSPEDVIVDNGPIPYIHLAPNTIRRLKNPQSRRNVPLHPEVVRLRFLDYVDEIKKLGYRRLFPDLYSPSSKSPMGDRFYREFKPMLSAADTDEKGFVIHSMRRGFGDVLKQQMTTEEQRRDLLGHVGATETSERYCDAYVIETLSAFIRKIPVVTERLTPNPLRLLPWVLNGDPAPFSRLTRGNLSSALARSGSASKSARGKRVSSSTRSKSERGGP